jgi:hypothetical protein
MTTTYATNFRVTTLEALLELIMLATPEEAE